MSGVAPFPALVLGLAGLAPFAAGALAAHGLLPGVGDAATGLAILQGYGQAILAFMGGCLWGFAAQAGRAGWKELGASVVPGLWAFSVGFAPSPLASLVMGYLVLLAFDVNFRLWGLGPDWWLRLRLPLTAGVLACLGAGLLA
jgi:hypothetical protein